MTQSGGRLGRRLGRILLVIPYAIRHPGVALDDLSARFGVDKKELIKDLNLLWYCGLPDYTPLELIEVDIEADRVRVEMADYFARPLRLTPGEALALYAGAAAIAGLPEMKEADALNRALSKLGRAIGGSTTAEVDVRLQGGRPEHLAALQVALAERKRVRMEYFSATRGAMTARELDPWGLVAALGNWYLVAWDHLHGEERMFRTDRIKSVEITDQAASVPSEFDPTRYKGAFLGDGRALLRLEISPEVARWFEDYYPVQSARDLDDGWRRVELISGGDRWGATLALRLGAHARVLEPRSVVEEARRLALAIAARHT